VLEEKDSCLAWWPELNSQWFQEGISSYPNIFFEVSTRCSVHLRNDISDIEQRVKYDYYPSWNFQGIVWGVETIGDSFYHPETLFWLWSVVIEVIFRAERCPPWWGAHRTGNFMLATPLVGDQSFHFLFPTQRFYSNWKFVIHSKFKWIPKFWDFIALHWNVNSENNEGF
jgi:hypothetical protein